MTNPLAKGGEGRVLFALRADSQVDLLAALEEAAQPAMEFPRLGLPRREVDPPELESQIEVDQRAIEEAAVLAIEQELALAIQQCVLAGLGRGRFAEVMDDSLL